jgi:hypothetical protein
MIGVKMFKLQAQAQAKSQAQVDSIKRRYQPGTRLELIQMDDDPNPVPHGTKATANFCDDVGTVHCTFDNGRKLGLIPGEDSFRVIEQTQEQKLELGGLSQ